MILRGAMLLLVTLVAGCGPVEGDDPGECTDGADNDRDGFFDCDDNDCMGSPVCNGGGPVDTGDPGDDPPDPRLLELNGVQIDYTLNFVFDFPVFGVEDCDQVFEGVGTAREGAAGLRVTFSGTWNKTGGTCPADLDEAVWHPNGAAYHSFVFTEDMAELDEWYAHGDEDGYHEEADPVWYVTEMEQPYDHSDPRISWSMSEVVPDIYGSLEHSLEIRLQK